MNKTLKTCGSFLLYLAFFIIIIIGIILAIRSHQTAIEISECELPCWHGITVGTTQEDEVIRIFDDFSGMNYQLTNYSSDMYFNNIEVLYFRLYPGLLNLSKVNGHVFIKENETIFLSLEGNIGLKAHYLIERFGEPEYVYSKPLHGEFYLISSLSVFYPEYGLIFELNIPYISQKIRRNSKVVSVSIISSEKFQTFINESGYYPIDTEDGSIFVPWSGYGEVEGKYWFPKGRDE